MSYHHVCTDTDCPLIGQRTDRFCRCHKTPEQMMQAEIEALRERRDDLLRANNAFEARAREAERALKAMKSNAITLDTIAERLTRHIRERGGPAKDANGDPIGTVWPAMIEAAAEIQAMVRGPVILRPASEYHEDMGAVLWWKLPITEPPYVGSPLSLGTPIAVTISHVNGDDLNLHEAIRFNPPLTIGGWPGYHTHFSPMPMVRLP